MMIVTLVGVSLVLSACSGGVEQAIVAPQRPTAEADTPAAPDNGPTGVLRLAFAGDVHFQLHLAALLETPRGGLGPIDRALAAADVAMVNLESAITERGVPEAKELEAPDERYHFRTSPAALDLLAAAGVDVVSVANNHGADYGTEGLADTVRAARHSPVAVLGVGRNRAQAFAPYRRTVQGTDLAFIAADASFREGSSNVWAAGTSTPGIAAARSGRPRRLIRAVRVADRHADVVVVYLHWGLEGQACPSPMQQTAARALSAAGADVIVGSHAHVLLGSGWLQDSYVSYGLGNFVWYHNYEPETGVLRLRIEDAVVVHDDWRPARIRRWGRPTPLVGAARHNAIVDWERLRRCARLAGAPAG